MHAKTQDTKGCEGGTLLSYEGKRIRGSEKTVQELQSQVPLRQGKGELGRESYQKTGSPRSLQQDPQSAERKVLEIGKVLAIQRKAG